MFVAIPALATRSSLAYVLLLSLSACSQDASSELETETNSTGGQQATPGQTGGNSSVDNEATDGAGTGGADQASGGGDTGGTTTGGAGTGGLDSTEEPCSKCTNPAASRSIST